MKKPILVVMAAGLGSRYGGLKQIDPVGKNGEIIIDYSVYDAYKAGFCEVVFVIKEENLNVFEETVGKRARKLMNVSYVYQNTEKYTKNKCDSSRIKPLGTAHAVLCAKESVNSSFVAINADDFYGREAFKLAYDFLTKEKTSDKLELALIGYEIEQTLTENGYVSRGVCKVDENSMLTEIAERTKIGIKDGKIMYTEDEKNYTEILRGTVVSMNMWAFKEGFMDMLEDKFYEFLDTKYQADTEKAECYLPIVVGELNTAEKLLVKVLKTSDKWYGITYKEDKEEIIHAIAKMTESGLYD